MFQTLTGSLLILLGVLAIIFAFALVLTAWLRWMFREQDEAITWSTAAEPRRMPPLPRAA